MEIEKYKMIYKIENKSNNLRILGDDFVKNNINKGKLIINNKKFSLKSIISINEVKKGKIEIILLKNIYNRSCMFKNCETLESFLLLSIKNNNDIIQNEENNTEKEYNNHIIENKEEIYLDSLNIDYDSFSSYYDINPIFSLTSQISSTKEEIIPESSVILHWNNELKFLKGNYTILNEMFSHCKSLLYLPDISKWDTTNVCNMNSN